MKKKVLSMFMAAVVVGTLAGCSEKGQEPEQKSSSAPTEVTDVTLKVWGSEEDQDEAKGQWLITMCEQFNTLHPEWNITFEYEAYSDATVKDWVVGNVSEAADVYLFANDQLPELVEANAIAKLDGEQKNYVESTNSESMVTSVTYEGEVYGYPYTSNTWFMYYDKSVFREDQVKDFDTMLEVAQQAGKKVAFPLSDSWYLAAFYVANGCTFYEDGTNEAAGIDFSKEKAVPVTQYLVDLAANPAFVNDTQSECMKRMGQDVAVVFSGTWDYETAKELLGANLGITQLPVVNIDGNEGQLRAFASSKVIGVNEQSANLDVAKELAYYLASEEGQLLHYQVRGIIPSNTNLMSDVMIASDPVAIAQGNCVNKTSIVQPVLSTMANYWKPANDLGLDIANGVVTHENAEARTVELNQAINMNVEE